MRDHLFLLIILLLGRTSIAQTQDDTLIGVLNSELIKINKNTGNIVNYLPVTGIPVNYDHFKLTWSEPDQCFYTLASATPAILAKIDLSGAYTVLGQLSIFPGNLFMCEGLAFNRYDGELYASGSINGGPNSIPADYYSETLLRIDISNLSTTAIGTFATGTPTISEADAITFDDNGILYLYDGQPGQFMKIFSQDISFLTSPVQLYTSSYVIVSDLTVKGNDLFFAVDRILKKINIPTQSFSSLGTMFTATDFNGELMKGITWKVGCPPSNVFGNDTTICSGQSLILAPTISGTSYLWQDGTTNSTLDASGGGFFWVEVSEGGCSYVDSIQVTIDPVPSVDLGNDTTICSGQLLSLTHSVVSGSLTWQDGSNGNVYQVSQPGVYWVSATNLCGFDTDSLNVAYSTPLYLNIGNDTSICAGVSIVLAATSAADSYLWQDGTSLPFYNASDPGTYWVVATLDGCFYYDSIIVTLENVPTVDLGSDQLICIGESVLLSLNGLNASIEWSTGSSESSILTTGDGLYWVHVQNECGSNSDSIIVQSEECFCILYVPNSFTPDENEHNALFGPIYDCFINDYTFEIYNRWGERIFETTDQLEHWDGTYKGRPVQDGIYIYKIGYASDGVPSEVLVGHVNLIR